MTEAQLQALVLALARGQGLLVHHCRDARHCTGDRGLPDLIIVGPGGVLWVELKDADGELSSAQVGWKYRLLSLGAGWRLWRPVDWDSGLIRQELAGLSVRQAA